MLIDINHIEHFYIICGPTDFRKGIEGCVQIVSQINGLDPFSESIFLFCNKRKDALKVLNGVNLRINGRRLFLMHF